MSSVLPFLLSLSIAIPTITYEPLKDQTWESCYNSGLEYQEYHVYYQYCQIDDNISVKFIQHEIGRDTALIFDFAKTVGIAANQDILNQNLEIYEVSTKTLNSAKFDDWSKTKGTETWGLYDPRVLDLNVSSIILTDHGLEWNQIVFAHELAHYWFDRLCWDKKWRGTPESFAQQFEIYYSQHKKDVL